MKIVRQSQIRCVTELELESGERGILTHQEIVDMTEDQIRDEIIRQDGTYIPVLRSLSFHE